MRDGLLVGWLAGWLVILWEVAPAPIDRGWNPLPQQADRTLWRLPHPLWEAHPRADWFCGGGRLRRLPEYRNPNPETRNPKPETRNREPTFSSRSRGAAASGRSNPGPARKRR